MKLGTFVAGVVTGLASAAISQELAKPQEDRTWKGKVAGVPYNFNLPEWSEVAREYWNPDSNDIITRHVVGMGWGINFAALTQRAREAFDGAQSLVERARPQTTENDSRATEPLER